MHYTLNQLQIFLKIAETKSITKAAEEMHLTQPAVSIQLKNFQNQFDIPLTEVVGRQIYITPFGKEIAEAAENIIYQVQAINHKTLAYKNQLSGKLKFSIVSTGKYIMPYYLVDFIKKNPEIGLQMDVTNKKMVIESLKNNLVDFSLVSILPQNLNINSIPLLDYKLYLVGKMPKNISKRTALNQVFKDLPLIFRESGSGTRQIMEQFILKYNISILKKLELTSNEAIKQAVMAGLGYSIMPIIGLKNEIINKELYIIPIKGLPIQSKWSLIWLKGKKHSPIAMAFLDYIHAETENIVNKNFSWYEQF